METLLFIREKIIRFIKYIEPILGVGFKFLLGIYLFSVVNSIGHMRPELLEYYSGGFAFTMLFGIAFALLPASISYFLLTLIITVQYSANLEIAFVIFVFLVCVNMFYVRMAPKEAVLIIATIIMHFFGMPYIIPLIAGMYFSVTAVIPVAIGVFIAYFIPSIDIIMNSFTTADLDIFELPDTFNSVYEGIVSSLEASNAWVYTAFIYAMVILLVNLVSKLALNYSRDIAIWLGAILMIFGFIIASSAGVVTGLGGIILLILFSGILMEGMRLFDPLLDYPRAQNVSFEDDENFYYVRVVPKLQKPRREEEDEEYEEEDEDEYEDDD